MPVFRQKFAERTVVIVFGHRHADGQRQTMQADGHRQTTQEATKALLSLLQTHRSTLDLAQKLSKRTLQASPF